MLHQACCLLSWLHRKASQRWNRGGWTPGFLLLLLDLLDEKVSLQCHDPAGRGLVPQPLRVQAVPRVLSSPEQPMVPMMPPLWVVQCCCWEEPQKAQKAQWAFPP